ncbi:MAG: hypothetical protein IPM54_40930 [Polyangiaceae bacterium]|nr:hypothetical protein [Polyangiaceae bacterium]
MLKRSESASHFAHAHSSRSAAYDGSALLFLVAARMVRTTLEGGPTEDKVRLRLPCTA